MSDKCPNCNAKLMPGGPPYHWLCGSRADGSSQSATCLGGELDLDESPVSVRDDVKRLQIRIDELEAIILACFFVWEDPVDASVPRMGMHLNVSDAMCLEIIEICKPRSDVPTAPGAAPVARPTN